ncbi:MAG: HAMP domain-containing protein [Myxococcales bacterium]|nr:HAMP domain-containing protein [Myxococcales bacterium]
MLSNWTIKMKLFALGGLGAAVLAALGIYADDTVREVKVDGANYDRIILQKDLVADILPPPEYIIESYLVAHLLQRSQSKDETTTLLDKMAALRSEYDTRHAFWDKALPEGPMRTELLRNSYEPARRFFAVVERQFIPAVERKDPQAVAAAMGELDEAYAQHRAAIDRTVEMAVKESVSIERETSALVAFRSRTLVVIVIASVAALVLLGWAIARSILRPIHATVQLIQDVAEGEGDLTRRLDEQGRDELATLSRSFNTFVEKLHDMMIDIRRSATAVTSASQRVAASAEQISSGAQEQASSLEQTAASLEEITAAVRQNSQNAQQAAQLAQTSRNTAEQGGQDVQQAVAAMREINTASKRIAEIITTIDEIAFQTNVLALNAAVEAARAGEQGRGFAVVAAEVGNLSQRSAAAAKEIKSLINEAVVLVDEGGVQVNRSGQTLSDIVTSVKRVTDIVGEIAAASTEQATGVEQVNTAVTQMDSVTQNNASETEALAETASTLSSRAHDLLSVVSRFRLRERGSQAEDEGTAPPRRHVVPPPARRPFRKASPSRVRRPEPEASGGAAEMDRIMSEAGGGGGSAGAMDGFEEV